MSTPVTPDKHDRDEWDDLTWDFLDEEAEGWADIPLACGVENPESCEACG